MVSTGAFALAIFAIVYAAFESLYFYSKETSKLYFAKAVLTGIPFIVYTGFYFSAFWKDDECVPEGDITTLFAIAFFFSGTAVVSFLFGYMLTTIHTLFYSSACILVITLKTKENLCNFKPEFLFLSSVFGALAFVLFMYFMKVEFQR